MSVTIYSEVPANATGGTQLTSGTLILSTPETSATGGIAIPISNVINLTETLNSKLNDTLGPIGVANIMANGADLNLLAGLNAYGATLGDFQKLSDVNATALELNYSIGLTGPIQDQIDLAYTGEVFLGAGEIIFSTDRGVGVSAPLGDVLRGTIGTGYEVSSLKPATVPLSMNTQRITDLAPPIDNGDAASKAYVDAQIVTGGGYLPLVGGTMTGPVDLDGNALILDIDGDTSLSATIDDTVVLNVSGVSYTWTIGGMDMAATRITNLSNPTAAQDAVTKNYVDTRALRVTGGNAMTGPLDLNGNLLILDEDSDTSIRASVDDVITFTIGGTTPVDVNLSGTGLDLSGLGIVNLADPSAPQGAATKNYVDTTALPRDGSLEMTGGLDLSGNSLSNPLDPTLGIHVGDRDYNDARYLKIASNFSDLTDLSAARTNLGLKTVAASGSYADLVNKPTLVTRLDNLDDVDIGIPSAGHHGYILEWNNTVGRFNLVPNRIRTVFGRTGDVTAQSGDYTATDITNVPAGRIAATNVQTALNELDTDKLARDGTQAMDASLNMGGHTITNIGVDFTVGEITLNATGLVSTRAGSGPSIKSTALPHAGNPTYSFVDFPDSGLWFNAGSLRLTVGGNDSLTVSANNVDVTSKKIVNVAPPTNDGDAVNLGHLRGMRIERVLGSLSDLDLLGATAGSLSAIYAVPTGKRHIITKLIVLSKTYTPGADPGNPVISVGISSPSYNQIVGNTVLSWGPNGASDQVVTLDPIQGASSPNASATITLRVDTPAGGTFTALSVDILVVGFEF